MTRGTRIILLFIAVFFMVVVMYYSRLGGGHAGLEGLDIPQDPLNMANQSARDEDAHRPGETEKADRGLKTTSTPELKPHVPPRATGGILADALREQIKRDAPPEKTELALDPGMLKKTESEGNFLPLVNTAPLTPFAATKRVPNAAKPNAQPSPVTPSPPTAPHRVAATHTVEEGDSLYVIAEEWFGDGSKWDLIAKMNPQVNPERLRIGQALRLPPQNAKRAVPRTPGNIHIVQSGDSLYSIAAARYGTGGQWRLIFEANRSLLSNDPNTLEVGMKLVIPPAAQAKD